LGRKTGEHRISAAQGRLRQLQSEIAAASPGSEISGLLKEVETALEELEVAHEELRQQNEELSKTREALEMQRHRYRHLFEHAPYGYLVTDVHGTIEEANQAAAALLGAAPWALAGKPLAVFLEEADRSPLRALIPHLSTGERATDREVRIKSRDGSPRAVVLTAVRDLDDSDKVQRLRWMLRDISQSKATEEALRESEERLRHSRRLESIGRLAGGIAHSFNNVLAAISFHSELLHEQLGEDDDRQDHVLAIQNAGDRAAALARQLLAFGRKQVLQPQVLDVNAVIRGLEPILRRLIGENIDLSTELDPQASPVNADLGQLEQVILNLVVNARDAMPFGGRLTLGTADAGLTPEDGAGLDLPPGRYLRLWVADTGTGMGEEVRSRLFEPFFTTKEHGKGTGLGLATVHGIVHQSGGAITVDSQPGRGACFSIYLPRTEQPAAVPVPPRTRSSRAQARSSERILLVEDEGNIREPAVEILESRGYSVLAAGDATEALALATQHPERIDVMITDVVMPGLSGSQLAERLTAVRPGLKVIYISGYPEDAIAHHGVLNPGHVFLQKPFSPAALLAKVREVLDGIPAHQG
jgi:two-component system cell cycle sensor histidine kinase/response regulator CckA